jgi:hypothetical protein
LPPGRRHGIEMFVTHDFPPDSPADQTDRGEEHDVRHPYLYPVGE